MVAREPRVKEVLRPELAAPCRQQEEAASLEGQRRLETGVLLAKGVLRLAALARAVQEEPATRGWVHSNKSTREPT